MIIENNKIELTEEENKSFILQFKIGILHQLYKENILSDGQLNKVLKSISK